MNITSKLCLQCSEPIGPERRKFCSQKCALKWHNAKIPWAQKPKREQYNARARERYHEDPESARAKMQKWRDNNPEKQKLAERRYREQNKNVLAQRNAEWRKENAEYVQDKARKYHAENRDAANAGRIARRNANLEIERARQRESGQAARIVSPGFKLIQGAKGRAKKYNLPFDLTSDWARSRWTGCCELTLIPFRMHDKGNGPKTFSPSIDQIIPRKGYTQDNCRIILWAVNALKHDGSDEDMYLVAAALMDIKFSST